MPRATGGFSMVDIRSASILTEYMIQVDPCGPAKNNFGGANLKDYDPRSWIACGEPPCGFDKAKYFTSVIGGFFVVAVVMGLLHTLPILMPSIQKSYDMGFVEFALTAALTYFVLITTSCLSSFCIKWVGHRQTGIFGIILVFLSVLLDAFVIHHSVFSVAYILLFGIGGGLAYGSSMAIAGDLFRRYLNVACVILSVAGPLGTMTLYWLVVFLDNSLPYSWVKVCLAIVILVFAAATHIFPTYPVDRDCSISSKRLGNYQRDENIKDCVQKVAKNSRNGGIWKGDDNEKTCLCVCVCDVNLWSDWSFLLWGSCVFLSTMNLYLPYMYILMFAMSIKVELSPWYICALCFGSCISRVMVLMNTDHTFSFRQSSLMLATISSGILWILTAWAETYGWIIVWCTVMGLLEGVIIVNIPNVTFYTIPLDWIGKTWKWILLFHALGVLTSTTFVAAVGHSTSAFTVGFTTVGICQLLGGMFIFLLPNEQENCNGLPYSGTQYRCNSFSRYPNLNCAQYKSFNYQKTIQNVGFRYGTRGRLSSNETFSCCCPICKEIGCFPECKGCVPGGLAGLKNNNNPTAGGKLPTLDKP